MTMRRQNGICAGVGRVISQHSVRWLSAVAVVIVTLVAVVFATSAASAGTPDRGRIIHLQTKLVSATTNPAGLGGPGDVIANLNAFTTSSGVVGHADITCQIFPNSEQECVASFVFPNGQIDTNAAITLPLTRFTAAVIGGTGAYEGVSGHIDNVVVSPGIIDRTFHLMFPGKD